MAETADRPTASDALICHLLVSSANRSTSSRDQRIYHVNTLDEFALAPLRRWDQACRAQGRPPNFEDFLEAYWIGFGCLRWLTGMTDFHRCGGCEEFVTENDLSVHAERCGIATEDHETDVPDPPEEIYMCPDEDCGFWSTEYTEIRAPHRSRAQEEPHSSQSFVLEDDPDIILDLWMKRHPARVMEICHCRLCNARVPPGRAALEHFVKRHTTAHTGGEIREKLVTGAAFPGKDALIDLICRTVSKRGIQELSVLFSPALQRAYREKIAASSVPVGSVGGRLTTGKWVDNVVDVVEKYFRAHRPSHSTVNVAEPSSHSPAQRLSAGRPSGQFLAGSHRAMKIRIRTLLRAYSGGGCS